MTTLTRGEEPPHPQCTKTAPAATRGDVGTRGDRATVPASPALIVTVSPRPCPHGAPAASPRVASPRCPCVTAP